MRALVRLGWVVLAALLVCLVWTASVLLAVRSDLTEAKSALVDLREAGSTEDLGPSLDTVQQRLQRSVDRLEQPGPRLVAALPWIGRTPTAVREATRAAGAVVAAGRDVLDAVPDDLLSAGRVDLAALRELQQSAETASAATSGAQRGLDAVDLAATPAVVGDGVRELRVEVASAAAGLGRAANALAALDGVLGGRGERRILFALENNAELRGTGGIVTVFAQGTARDGAVRLGAFTDVEDVADPPTAARPVPAPADYLRLYGPYKAASTLWKNANMSPDVPTSSVVLAEIAARTTGARPDVVVWFDVPLIGAILRATGPAVLPDGSVLDGGNAVQRLLSDAYRDAPDTPEGQQVRRAQLRAAADAVIGKLLGSGDLANASATALARELGAAADGRHLALWSRRAEEEAPLRDAGLDGAVSAGDGDLSALTLHNLGGGDSDGNKLDFYGRRTTEVRAVLARDHVDVVQTMTLTNGSPASGLPVYVSGRPDPGVSRHLATLALPSGATNVRLVRDDQRVPVEPLPEGDHAVVQDVVVLRPGATATWTLRYRLPVVEGRYAMRIVPQPLAVDATYEATLIPADGLRLDRHGTASGALDRTITVRAAAHRPDLLGRARDSVRRFWSEPVRLP